MARITVEDCLTRENNRFALVILASKRAKQLLLGSPHVVDTKGNKSIVSALREIAASKVRFMTGEEQVEHEEQLKVQAEIDAQAQAQQAPVSTNGHGFGGSGASVNLSNEDKLRAEIDQQFATQAAANAAKEVAKDEQE